MIPLLEITKTATPSESFLRIGDTVDYEVTVENVREGDFTTLYPVVCSMSCLAAGPPTGMIDDVMSR